MNILRKTAWATAAMLAAMLPAKAQTVTMPEAKPTKPGAYGGFGRKRYSRRPNTIIPSTGRSPSPS